jgi:hypothetical protein
VADRLDGSDSMEDIQQELDDEHFSSRSPSPLKFDLDDDEQTRRAGTIFNYGLLPTLQQREIISVALYQIKTRCNVALDTHLEYLDVFQALLDSAIMDTRTVESLLERVTGITHERYDVCRNGCICFAKPEYTERMDCPFCGEARHLRPGKLQSQPVHCMSLVINMIS